MTTRNMNTAIAQLRLSVLNYIWHNRPADSIMSSDGTIHKWQRSGADTYAHYIQQAGSDPYVLVSDYAEMWDILEEVDNSAVKSYAHIHSII